MIRCHDNSLYTGVSMDVERRFKEHQEQGARCAKYLRGKAPLVLVFMDSFDSKRLAMQAEIKVKSLTKQQKESLISIGNYSDFIKF